MVEKVSRKSIQIIQRPVKGGFSTYRDRMRCAFLNRGSPLLFNCPVLKPLHAAYLAWSEVFCYVFSFVLILTATVCISFRPLGMS